MINKFVFTAIEEFRFPKFADFVQLGKQSRLIVELEYKNVLLTVKPVLNFAGL